MMRPYAPIAFIERPLDGDGALQRLHRRPERRHEAVAHGLDLGAAVGAEALAGDALVLAQDLSRLGVGPALGHRRGALYVSEEDGTEGGCFGRRGRLYRSWLCQIWDVAFEDPLRERGPLKPSIHEGNAGILDQTRYSSRRGHALVWVISLMDQQRGR